MLLKTLKPFFQTLLGWSLLALTPPVFAQNISTSVTTPPSTYTFPTRNTYGRHAFTVETLGHGGLYSLNYDYLFSLKSAAGLGISYQALHLNPSFSDAEVQLITVPVYANFYFPFAEHRPFVSTAVTFLKAHASANVDLSNIFAGMQLTYQDPLGNGTTQELKVDKADMSLNNEVDILVAIPSLGAGYEYRTSEGAIFRLQALAFVYEKIVPWAGLSFGVGL